MRAWLVGGLLLAVIALGAPAASSRQAESRATSLAPLIRQIAATARAPGAVLVTSRGGGVRRQAIGLADRRTGEPMRVGARFRIASMSKTFVAAALLQLAGEGRLELDSPVRRWLPAQFGVGHATIRQLLNHTSGIYAGGPLDPLPGRYVYANANYNLVGRVLTAVTGASPRHEIERRITRPLRLTGTLWPRSAVPPRLARGYSLRGADVSPVPTARLTPADAVVSSADDLRRFLAALLGGGLIGPRQLAAMKTSIDVGDEYRPLDQRYGLGLMGYDTECGPVWGHRGRTHGYTVFAFATPDGARSAVVALNIGRVSDATVARLNPLVFAAVCA